MNKLRILSYAATAALAAIAFQLQAQHYSCAELDWPEQIAAIYENVAPACEETIEIDGVRFGRFEATFLREKVGQVTLGFRMPDGNTITQTFRPPETMRVNVDGKQMAFHQLLHGQNVTLLIPEKR